MTSPVLLIPIPGGFGKSWRKELQSDVWLMPPIYHRVWYWLRLNAQYETFLFPTREQFGIWVLPGQRITSLRQIAEGVKWVEWGREVVPNVKTVKTVLDWLESREMVTVESNAKGTLVSIVNWHTYNDLPAKEVTAQSNSQGTRSGYKEERIERIEEKTKPLPSPEACRLSGLLADLIQQNNPGNRNLNNGKREGTVSRWAVDIEKLLRIDKKSPTEIEGVIRWCQADSFWQGNILSGATLRKQWDKLTVKMKAADKDRSRPYEERKTRAEIEALI